MAVFRLKNQVRIMKYNAICSGYMVSLLTGHVFSQSESDISVYG